MLTLYAASNQTEGERSRRHGRAADLLVEIRACEIHGMRYDASCPPQLVLREGGRLVSSSDGKSAWRRR